MALRPEHEMHRRRFGRNVGVSLTLGALVAVIFGMTVVKIANGSLMEAYDHQPRASQLPVAEAGQ